jgi:hypothetical protein
MTRLITKAALLTACGMLVAVAAMAGIPSPGNSTSPNYIKLAGSVGAVPDTAACKFTVTVRDIANNTLANSYVTVDFVNVTTATGDIKIASNQLNPNYTVLCSPGVHTVSAYTNASGQVAFSLLGNSFSIGTHTNAAQGRIYADGVLISSPSIATFDMNGSGGVSAADISPLVTDIAYYSALPGDPTHYRERADMNGSGTVTAADISTLVGVMSRLKSTATGATCTNP